MDERLLFGTLERIARALEAQVMLQKRALIRMGWLVNEEAEQGDEE